ncbi:(2Fe-2S)-binding protein [Sphingobium lactosutens]|nr:(2Fe-2S)-binding protein [Sphingobium lactosutens]
MVMLHINGQQYSFEGDPRMPLLWYLRDEISFTGTKFGCGMALCGACTVHLNGDPVRSCQMPVGDVGDRQITTIEAMSSDRIGKAVQDAWIAEQVPQCGYCQSGQIMSATALLRVKAAPSDEDIDAALSGNICRCATYRRIRTAVHKAAQELR